ncbi:MAG: hybrid sensor histidine kinase/response regulator [Microcoleaceae cyanobacterium]
MNILLIEDSLAEARLLQELLKDSWLKNYDVIHVKRLSDALQQLQQTERSFNVILLDLSLPDSQGLDSLKTLIHDSPELPIVVLTNTNDGDLALDAVRWGAQDYLLKRQVTTEVLVRSLRYAIERKQVIETLRQENESLGNKVQFQSAELIKAKEQNRRRSEFVSMMSHDFRNPLCTILLSTELLKNSDKKLTPAHRKAIFKRIKAAGNNMVQLLDEVILVGKSDLEQLKWVPAPLNLANFCQQLIEELQHNTSPDSQILLAIQGNLEGRLWDEHLLRHILSNLLTNAVKYSPNGGTIQLTIIAENHQVQFQVQDQGIGISVEDQKRLFQAFQRGHNVGEIDGTGLGLAIVQRCLEACNGKVKVESHLGEGSTFIVTIPNFWE